MEKDISPLFTKFFFLSYGLYLITSSMVVYIIIPYIYYLIFDKFEIVNPINTLPYIGCLHDLSVLASCFFLSILFIAISLKSEFIESDINDYSHTNTIFGKAIKQLGKSKFCFVCFIISCYLILFIFCLSYYLKTGKCWLNACPVSYREIFDEFKIISLFAMTIMYVITFLFIISGGFFSNLMLLLIRKHFPDIIKKNLP